MRKLRSLALVVLVALVGGIDFAPTAQADRGPTFTLTVDRHVVHSGEQFTASAGATSECDWLLEWNGDRRVQKVRRLVTTYTAPAVSGPTRIPLHATCFYAPTGSARGGNRDVTSVTGIGRTAERITVTVPQAWRHTLMVTVLPPRSAVSPPESGAGTVKPGGNLPLTGGPPLWALLAGVGTVLIGRLTARVARTTPRRMGA